MQIPCREPVIDTPTLDCDCLLSHFLNISRAYILSHPEQVVEQDDIGRIFSAMNLRISGLPIAYIIGKKEFYGRDFFVSPAVLIPKPDTEILVEKSLFLLRKLIQQNQSIRVVDVCTGSGCVAVTVWKELSENLDMSEFKFFATDISHEVLTVAKKNCLYHSSTIEFILADLLQDNKLVDLDMIISNPPYVPHHVAKELLEDGRSEPMLALDGDCDGTHDGTGLIARLISQSYRALKSGGYLILETGEYNAEATGKMMRKNGFMNICIHKDLAGMFRVVEGKKV